MVDFVNSKKFTYTWFGLSFLMLAITSVKSYQAFTWLYVLTFLDSFSDIWLEHFYSLGVSRKLTAYNCLANLLGIVVQFSYGLYGGAVTSSIGFILLLHKTLTWNHNVDGKITKFKKEEVTLMSISVFLGILVLGLIYGHLFLGEQPVWLMCLNILIFVLGTGGRILLINGKVQAQYVYVIREIVELSIFISMLVLGTVSGSFWIRLSSIVSSLIILFKGVVNWTNSSKDS